MKGQMKCFDQKNRQIIKKKKAKKKKRIKIFSVALETRATHGKPPNKVLGGKTRYDQILKINFVEAKLT
jgi:hypothetical protein